VIFTHNKDYIIPLFVLPMSDLFLGLNMFFKKLQNFIFDPYKIEWHVKPLFIFE
jgi:hypothetical protein